MDEADFLIPKNKGVAIVGLGVMGGSIAGALISNGYSNIYGIDNQEEAITKAQRKGYIAFGSLCPEDILPLADIVIVCLYPHKTVEFIKKNNPYFKKNAIITDVSGIKRDIMDAMQGCLRADLEFVGGHPMSGNNSKGIDYSNPNMFVDASYLITPSASNTKEAINSVKNLAIDLGCKTVLEIDVFEHDEAIAIVSHMPHLAALALMNICDVHKLGDLLGPSFKDATRVAQINSKLWSELFISNKSNLDQQIGLMQDKMQELRVAILDSDINKLEELMDHAKKQRETIA